LSTSTVWSANDQTLSSIATISFFLASNTTGNRPRYGRVGSTTETDTTTLGTDGSRTETFTLAENWWGGNSGFANPSETVVTKTSGNGLV
ncbi:hypothetical protein ABTL40_19405, partial [Acinetobacter baumannii]